MNNQEIDLLDYLQDPSVFDFKEGYVELFDPPELGIEINGG
ncbi:MAG: hypothetical protein QM485_15735 [Flavobacteriaceae bacterium]